jgi:hypothetical protein
VRGRVPQELAPLAQATYARAMLRAALVTALATLWLSGTMAQAQRELPAPSAPLPGESAPPVVGEPPAPAASPLPEPAAPAITEEPPAPPPPPEQRYEGQVGGDPSAPAYEEDFGKDEDKSSEPKGHGSSIPGFSIRMDPLNWLIEGRLGIELEVVAWEFITAELLPVFVVNDQPPALNFSGRDDPISQHSNGLGPIAGASIGAGFWLSGKPFEGYVVRAIFTNYAFTYRASDSSGVFDTVHHTERQIVAYIGSHSRFGFFTIAGGIGLGYELNQQQRCFVNLGSSNMMASSSGCPDSGELHILLDRKGNSVADLNGGLHPIYLMGRLSLGVAFD